MLKTIEWETTQIEDRSYNDAGLLTGVDRTYVDETRTYNAGSQLTQISSTNVGSQTYTYDLNGNVTSETLSGNMANCSFTTISGGNSGYDDEDRFMRFIRSGVSEDIQLTRSDIGNISNVNLNGGNTARGYNNIHSLTSVGAASQTYDTDGNTTTLLTAVTAAWDDAGRMKNTDVSSSATAGIEGLNEYGYVGGTRVWKKITRNGKGGPSVVEHRVFIHAGPNMVAEYNAGVAASTPVQEYVYADEIDSLVMIRRSNGTKYGVSRNRQWSVVALHDLANGDVVERYAYEMTGKRTIYAANGTTVRTTSSYGNNFGYTNRWHDEESGLMYFRARYYNPLTGEFLSRDPMAFVDGMSLYRGYFVPGGVDPTGHEACGTCRAKLQRGDTPRKKRIPGPEKGKLATAKGVATGWLGWLATDSGVIMASEVTSKVGFAAAESAVAVSCWCVGKECQALAVLGSIGYWPDVAGKRPKADPKLPLGDAGAQDIFLAQSYLAGVSTGDTITIWGYVAWSHTARTWYHSLGHGLNYYDKTVSNRKYVRFTWKCIGTCP